MTARRAAGARSIVRLTEARDSHARITVLSVAEMPLNPDAPRFFGTLDDIAPGEGGALAPPPDVVAHLTEARERPGVGRLRSRPRMVGREPGREIVDTAKRIRARTIVLGEHHHGVLSSFFGGDVDEAVKREAGCTVILA